jgi:hypothetical protein
MAHKVSWGEETGQTRVEYSFAQDLEQGLLLGNEILHALQRDDTLGPPDSAPTSAAASPKLDAHLLRPSRLERVMF